MTRYELTRIGVVSLAKIYAVIVFVMTLLFGWPVLVFEAMMPGSGFAAFLGMLIFSVVGGIIGGAVSALVYNFAATPLGGVVLELDRESVD